MQINYFIKLSNQVNIYLIRYFVFRKSILEVKKLCVCRVDFDIIDRGRGGKTPPLPRDVDTLKKIKLNLENKIQQMK